jgi:hypothetical protein
MRICALALFLLGLNLPAPAQDKETADPNPARLVRLFDLQEKIRDLHPAFERLFPVAIVEAGRFFIYVPDGSARIYRLDAQAPDKFKIPTGIRAAMPLDFWGTRVACVVTPEVFAEPAGYVMIFHEFVHCYQWETVELRLKESLGVYKKAMERKDYMWELQYAFPYGDEWFVREYGTMLAALDDGDFGRAANLRKAIKARLSADEWDYMTWQEWKEGSARYLENEVRGRFVRPANSGGKNPPYSRVTFYAGGEAFIRMLEKKEAGSVRNLEDLYRRIAE